VDIALVSNSMHQVAEEPVHNPARAVLLGPARVIPKELPGITCRSIDLDLKSKSGCRMRRTDYLRDGFGSPKMQPLRIVAASALPSLWTITICLPLL